MHDATMILVIYDIAQKITPHLVYQVVHLSSFLPFVASRLKTVDPSRFPCFIS